MTRDQFVDLSQLTSRVFSITPNEEALGLGNDDLEINSSAKNKFLKMVKKISEIVELKYNRSDVKSCRFCRGISGRVDYAIKDSVSRKIKSIKSPWDLHRISDNSKTHMR
ncbi:hypothetical protein RCL_jg9606.t1 [Rhizophagus clarus]|uniref:Uncharacterized protein n=1 Tax=Rhizophagus clarus TaxID=94130 RepID=A0A8H3QX83_9GLOM|nr:hypothetical protein RCL_jg9606.t1 [Rhizophagus clarus]